jgi:uncharacterized membrane protein YqgA involved in biofilm formation
MLGTWVNIATVLVGGVLGLLIHSRLPERHRTIAFRALGLVTLMLGMSMALRTQNAVILILSMLIGSLIGETLHLETRLEKSVDWVRRRFAGGESDGRFTEGAITAFMLFCMGSMTVVGALEDGMGRSADLLIAKSVMDGFAAIALSASFGVGVLFSVVPLFLYQGGWSLVGWWLGTRLPGPVIDDMSAVGGVILLGLALSLLDIKKLPLLNMLPALFIAIILGLLWPELAGFWSG